MISGLKELLYKTKVYMFVEHGWWYGEVKGIYFKKEEAIARWEKIYSYEKVKWSKEAQEKIIRERSNNGDYQGFWGYAIEETTFEDIFNSFLKEEKRKWESDETERLICEKDSDRIFRINIEEQIREEFTEIMRGAVYFLQQNEAIKDSFNTFEDRKTLKKDFEKYLGNVDYNQK